MTRVFCIAILILSLIVPAGAALPPVRDFAVVTVSQGYDNDDTTVVLTPGDGAKLPVPASEGAFYLVWWNYTDYASPGLDTNREIIKVTARSTDTLTIVRGQGGTSAVNHNTGGKTYRMQLSIIKVMWDAIQDEISTVSGSIPNVVNCDAFDSCNAAVTDIGGSAVKTLQVSDTETVASNLSVTPNITIWPVGGGLFSINTSVTLTIDSPAQLELAPIRQIFSGAGSVAGVTFTKAGTVYPQWWGAVCDGSTDDGPEIQSAINSIASSGGIVALRGCTYKSNQELVVSGTDVTIRGDAGAKIDGTSISGSGTADIHDTANVLAVLKVTGTRVRVVGLQITGTATVSSKKIIGIWVHAATQTRVGGVKIDSMHVGIWVGGNSVEPTFQNVELASNEHNLLLGYRPVTSTSPQVSRATLINVVSRNATVGDGVQLYSYANDTRIIGGQFYSNAGWGINGYVGGATTTIVGAHGFSNTSGGLQFTYNSLTGTTSNKLGYANKLTVSASRFSSNSGDGVSIQLPDYSLFSTIGGVEDVSLSDVLSDNNTGDGFDLGLVRSSVRGSRALGNQGDGFNIRSSKSTSIVGNQAWDNGQTSDNRRGFNFIVAATTGSTPANSTLISFTDNQAGDTRSGGSRTCNYGFDLEKLDSGEVANNNGNNCNTAEWKNTNGSASVSFLNNRGTVSGSDVVGTPLNKILTASGTWDPTSLNTNVETSTTLTVTGAAVGDICIAGHTQVTADLLQLTCIISASNTARVVLENISSGTIDVTSGTLGVAVIKR